MKVKIDIEEARSTWLASNIKVGCHRRKTRARVYESARIVLPSEFKDLIGKRFKAYRGRGKVQHSYGSAGVNEYQGQVVVLFFDDRLNPRKEPIEWKVQKDP